ncbi:MAG: class I SAM-dependent methyltransferase [Acidobacteria bacterium]|nr:class I SAM-dependent methyltransferase [Acidobacteriota bacterium]
MGIYRERILPRLMEFVLGRPIFLEQRRVALGQARGRALEIGFGFGASLPAYPDAGSTLTRLVAIDPNRGMNRRAARRTRSSPFPVDLLCGRAEALPMVDDTFDTVVTNWTLCSLPDPRAGLREIRRVLKPDGRFLFLEHGRAEDPRLARRQERLTPLQRLLAGGCRLDLPIDELIRDAGLRIASLERYEMPWGPRSLRQMYRGVALP